MFYSCKNHFLHHLTKWTETFANQAFWDIVIHQLFAIFEEQFNLRQLRKPQLSLHLVVVALSPVEQRQSLCTKDLLFLYLSKAMHKFTFLIFYVSHMPDIEVLNTRLNAEILKVWLDTWMTSWKKHSWPKQLGEKFHKNCAGMLK